MEATPLREGFVGVHIGAGQHSEAKTPIYFQICAAACQAAVDILRAGGSASDAAEAATMVLEDAGETNAGFGSNLTETGAVEMDAGFMDGSSLIFGAVGAVSGVKNPVRVARRLVEEQKKGLLPMGRVPPGFLAGEGARVWAARHGIPSVDTEQLVSKKSAKLYKHYKRKLDIYQMSVQQNESANPLTQHGNNKRKKESGNDENGDEADPVVLLCKKVNCDGEARWGEGLGGGVGERFPVAGHPALATSSRPAIHSSVASLPAEWSTGPPHVMATSGLAPAPLNSYFPQLPRFPTAAPSSQPVYQQPTVYRAAGQLPESVISRIANEDDHTVQPDYSQSTSSSSSASATEAFPGHHAEDDHVTDTVGVVVLDRQGRVASNVSSGGIALKQPGRVGQAACYGCGCWAQKEVLVSGGSCGEGRSSSRAVAVSTTGCGEHLTRVLLARECAQGLCQSTTPTEDLQKIMREKFVESPFLAGVPVKLGGAICLQYNREKCEGYFLWTHTTASMGIGFQSTAESDAKLKMSRLPKSSKPHGTTVLVESIHFNT